MLPGRSPPPRNPPLRIALAQIDCDPADPAANRAALHRWAGEAEAAGCAAVFFPELSDTGYHMPAVARSAGAWPGPGYDAARGAAREHGIAVTCGLAERVGGTLYNSLAAFDAAGEPVGTYRKAHLFNGAADGEPATFAPGDEPVVVELAGERWGLSVCYDLRFPEWYSRLTARGARALVNCSAWPVRRREHWDLLTRARAVENQAFFVGVNRCGTDAGLPLAGCSRVVSPMGEVVAEAGPDEEALIVADLDFAAVDAFRTALPALAARRPDLYRADLHGPGLDRGNADAAAGS